MSPRPAVFLDRDGVLNLVALKAGKPHPPADAASLTPTPGAPALLARLKKMGFVLICVTNQPDFARGARTLANIEAMNRKVRESLPLDDLLTCLHDGPDNCACRKPKPGLLLEAAGKWGVDLSASWMVGDRASDVAAGRAAGCRTIFLAFGYAERPPEPAADFTCGDLAAAVDIIESAKETGDESD
ncbi:MAG: HAD family hydrolase [Planctomycetota bacterium]|nr:HAD family hydrolase [Planctomycetota bacterium]